MYSKDNIVTIFFDTPLQDVKQLLQLESKLIVILNNDRDVLGILNENGFWREINNCDGTYLSSVCDFLNDSFKVYSSLESIDESDISTYDYAVLKNDFGYECYSMNEVLLIRLKGKITNLINTNKTLQQEIEVSRHKNNELKQILNSTYDEIFVTDADGNTLFVSESSKKLTGLPPEAFIGRNVKELNEKGVIINSATLKTIETGKVQTAEQNYPTGITVLTTSQPIFDNKGDLYRIVSSSRDITELVEMKKRLDQMRMENDKQDKNKPVVFYYKGLITANEQMLEVIHLAKKVAKLDSSILISGESGVGKGMLARMIHDLSQRKEKKFIKVNCGAIPPSLIESELFGYEGGAFTGASKKGKLGLVELASDGTLFLDEIGEMPMDMQVKLLHLVQEKTFMRVGGTKEIRADIRIISATNRDLQRLISEGKFREDLYYRLHVVPLHIPPLRERKDDILILIDYFLMKFNQIHHQSVSLDENSKLILQLHGFPGNVRELENLMEQIVVTTSSPNVSQGELQMYFQNGKYEKNNNKLLTLKQVIEKTEKQVIKQALEDHKTTRDLAKVLGVSQTTIMRKLKKYGLTT